MITHKVSTYTLPVLILRRKDLYSPGLTKLGSQALLLVQNFVLIVMKEALYWYSQLGETCLYSCSSHWTRTKFVACTNGFVYIMCKWHFPVSNTVRKLRALFILWRKPTPKTEPFQKSFSSFILKLRKSVIVITMTVL